MAISEYTVTIDLSWVSGWGIPSRTAFGFHIDFNVAAPPAPLAKLRYAIWGGSPPRKLTEAIVDITEDALSADIVFGAIVEDPYGERTASVIQLEMYEIRAAMMRIIKQERLDAVDLGGRVEQYTSVKLKELSDLYDKLKEELDVVLSVLLPRSRVFRSRYSKGL